MLNFLVNFVLLQITALLTKRQKNLFRFVISSAFAGIYSLIIFVDELPKLLLILSKIASAMIIIFIAFDFSKISSFFKSSAIFLLSSIIVLGYVIFICFVFKISFVAINNSVLYFDVSAPVIILSALLSYIFMRLFLRFYNRSLSKKEIYTLTIKIKNEQKSLLAILDSGNRLREPFSNMPVIVVSAKEIGDFGKESISRYVPTSSINGTKLLSAFKPDYIEIKTINGCEKIENAYIAISDDFSGEVYSALLNYDILSI